MSYADEAALATDAAFTSRLNACLCEEAQTKPEDDVLAPVVLRSPQYGGGLFMPFVSTAPGFGEAYANDPDGITDAMLLSAVQAAWPKVAAIYHDPTQP